MNGKVGIILEGGAMRSIFTAGVLDFFLDKQIDIPNVLAVSAGAYAGMNYVSGQRGRVMDAVIKPMATRKIMSAKHFFRHGEFFDMDLLFDKIPKEEAPFDFEAFQKSDKRFVINTINCKTGEPVWYEKFDNLDEFLHIARVANSLPLLSKIGYIDGIPMMDGGMVDAIPISKALDEKWDKIVVVFTRDRNYRKSAKGDIYNSKAVKMLYRRQKGLLQAIACRPAKYNASIEVLNLLEKEGRAFIFRPEGLTLTNNERNLDKLMKAYEHGYANASNRYDEFREFLNR